jgi:hypothetical protein
MSNGGDEERKQDKQHSHLRMCFRLSLILVSLPSLAPFFFSLFPFVVAILKDDPSQDAIGPELRSVQ